MTQDEMWLLKEKYMGERTEGFFSDCARLKLSEPLAYVIGSIPFLNTTIHLDTPIRRAGLPVGQAGPRPLIPRTETEYWVDETIKEIKKNSAIQHPKILDLCAGSGCIGVSVLKEVKNAYVDFVEVETSHHAIILKNIKENGIKTSRAHIFGGDLFKNIPGTYDYILTNPPYIDKTLHRTEASVNAFEPEKALYGGQDGMEIIARIIASAPLYLEKNGVLVIEHEPEQVSTIQTLAKENGFTSATFPDQFGVLRYTRLTRTN